MRIRHASGALLFLALGGCSLFSQKQELASDVAKNWCLTIRASQVIPVYPLTEDVRVGDLFIVERPIEDEVKLYQQNGFLPLTHQIGRVDLKGFDQFYPFGSYGVTKDNHLPTFFQTKVAEVGMVPEKPSTDKVADPPKANKQEEATHWAIAPRAKFPTYSFGVDRNSGFQAGLPIHGVPLALGVLGSQHAEASVSLDDAYTYGMEEPRLLKQVRDWVADQKPNVLLPYSPRWEHAANLKETLHYNYLRIITRVYFVGKVAVTVKDTSAVAAQADIGVVSKNLQLLGLGGDGSKNNANVLTALNDGLTGKTSSTTQPSGTNLAPTKGAPVAGGSVKFSNVTNSSVSIDETFDRPLVIGYLAIDLPIDYDGRLGTIPINTQLRLDESGMVSRRLGMRQWAKGSISASRDLKGWVEERGNGDWIKKSQVIAVKKDAGSSDTRHYEKTEEVAAALLARLKEVEFWKGSDDTEAMDKLSRLVIAEIIERPPGTGIDRTSQLDEQIASIKAAGSTTKSLDDVVEDIPAMKENIPTLEKLINSGSASATKKKEQIDTLNGKPSSESKQK